MDDKTKGCLKTAGIGCGIAIVIAVAVPVILAVMIMIPLNSAVENRQAIEGEFGTQEDFVPPLAGAPSADRIEAFLEVESALAAVCADLEYAESQVAALEALDDEDEVSRMKAMKLGWSTTRSMMGVGAVIGQLYEVRNQSLLEHNMGLGEFTYIYVTANHDQLLDPSNQSHLFGPGTVNARVRGTLRSMLENQRAALVEAGGDSEEISALEAEIAVLGGDSSRIPWQDGLPEGISEAYLPFRTELDEIFCPAAAPLALMINEKRGLAIEGI